MYFMGIDGGGSNLRVVITDEQQSSVAEAYSGSVNPSLIGRDASANNIQATMRSAMAQADKPVVAVGIGIAGASKAVAEDWLYSVVRAVLPDALVVPSSDNEIALVGATGKREGLLLLAGTGSGGFGINRAGQALQVGGWGYLLGDEGSGYWMGLKALKMVTNSLDAGKQPSQLVSLVMRELSATNNRGIINWVYHEDKSPIPRIAKLVPLVLQAAADGDKMALDILEEGTDYFCNLTSILKERLDMPVPEIAFAGSLLTTDNIYSNRLIEKLNLLERPKTRYEPMIGAALLAKIVYEEQNEAQS